MSARHIVSAVLFFVLLVGTPGFRVFADTNDCPAGARPATASDLQAMTSAGIPNPTVGMCWNASDQQVGQNIAQAKNDLQSDVCGNNVNVQDLNSKFVSCADKLMQALKSQDSRVCITSAYRDSQYQANVCKSICGNPNGCKGTCAPPGSSYHQYGLAIDISSNNNISNQKLWQTAAQFGLLNPSGLHSSDPRHVQASGGTDCSSISVPQNDNGDYYNDSNQYFQPGASLPFDSSLRSTLGLQQMNTQACATSLNPVVIAQPGTVLQSSCLTNASVQQPQLPQTPSTISTTPTTASTQTTGTTQTTSGTTATTPSIGTLNSTVYPAGTCQAQVWCYSGSGNLYVRASTCVDQLAKQCQNGCAGTSCNATSSSATGAGSATDFITQFLEQHQSSSTPTSTPVVLNPSVQAPGGVANVVPGSSPYAASASSTMNSTGGITSGGAYAPQTFTSSDLSYTQSSLPSNTALSTLQQMKNVLYGMLSYLAAKLQPFGTLSQPVAE